MNYRAANYRSARLARLSSRSADDGARLHCLAPLSRVYSALIRAAASTQRRATAAVIVVRRARALHNYRSLSCSMTLGSATPQMGRSPMPHQRIRTVGPRRLCAAIHTGRF